MPRGRKKTKRPPMQKQLDILKKRIFNSTELKYHCKEGNLAVSNAGNLSVGNNELTLIPQGTKEGERLGDSVMMKRLVVRYNVIMNDSTNGVRVIIIRCYGDTSNLTLADFPIGSTATMEHLGCYATKKLKYDVLYDKILVGSGTSNASNHIQYRKVNLKLNKQVKISHTGTPTSTQSGGLMLFAVSDSTLAPHPAVQFISQLSYTDG